MNDKSKASSEFTAGPSSTIGRAGEPRAIEMTRALLEAQGHAVQFLPSRDSDGEDTVITIAGVNYTAQVTSSPDAPKFWSQAKQGSASTTVTPEHAASWVEGSIAKKIGGMSAPQRANTILIVDVHEWGDRLAQPAIVTRLKESDLNPAKKHGLAGIAIAGNSPSKSTWLGGGLR